LDAVERYLRKNPIRSGESYFNFEAVKERMREESPLVADQSMDVVVSNCVLNLVRAEDKLQLFREMHRVLKRGGRAAISDIVSDEAIPEELKNDPELWSGCISGAFEESAFLRAFEEAGFFGIQIERRDDKPWRTVRGIEFRSMTVTACKGKEGACWERNQAVMYKGPWKQVQDDDGHVLKRGVRSAVCDKTFHIYSRSPYAGDLILIPPHQEIPPTKAKPFDCSRDTVRDAKETKGLRYKKTTEAASRCMDGGCC
jgi:SAM-dependent methyltransferase